MTPHWSRNRLQAGGFRPSQVYRRWEIALLALACVGQAVANGAETLWLRSLGVDQGLSQHFISAIAQDRDGFMWFGTLSGLNRWDGYRFDSFVHVQADPTTLSDSGILALHTDGHGILWVGTNHGLDCYDPVANAFRRYGKLLRGSDALPPVAVEGITSDRAGRVWYASFSGPRLYRLDPHTGEESQYVVSGLPRHRIGALCIDRSDRLWVATQLLNPNGRSEEGGWRLLVFDRCSEIGEGDLPTPRQPFDLEKEGGMIATLLEDAAGRLWIGRNGGGLIRFDPRTGARRRLAADSSDPTALTHGIVRSLALGPAGELWVLTLPDRPGFAHPKAQLHRVDPDTLIARRVSLRQETSRVGDDATLQHLATDQSGVLWLGSNAGGLRYADVSAGGFSVYRQGAADIPGLNSSYVRAVCKGRDGTLWVGTPVGINRIDRSKPDVAFSFPAAEGSLNLPQPNVQAILEDRQGNLWIGTAGGLAVREQPSGTVRHYRADPAQPGSLRDDYILVIHEDADGTLWCGTLGHGLSELDPLGRGFRNYAADPADPASLPAGTIHALYSDRQKRLWIGTAAGLARLEPSPKTQRRFVRIAPDSAALGGVVILSICESTAAPDVLWIGTAQRGLGRLDPADGTCRFYTRQNSALPDDTVYGVLADRRGRLWLSTNRGLVCFDPAGESFCAYGVERGLQSSEFNARAYFQAADGEMFFGGVGGLNSFYPEQITDNLHAPRVAITGVSVVDRRAKLPESAATLIHRLGLPPHRPEIQHRQRDLTFDFVALHYSDPALNRCEYRLEGYDADWHGPVALRRARYTNLDPGDYTFRVRAISSHGVRSRGDATFSFVVLPPFYATGWFRALAVLGLAAMFLGSHGWRTHALRRRQKDLENKVAQRTEELRQALATVEGQAQKLQELGAAKSRFFANLSHEFRTPLTLTLGPLRDLLAGRHGAIPAEACAKVELAIRNTSRQLELVEQLLLLARLDAGQLELHPCDLRLDVLLREATAPFETLAERQGIRLQLELPDAPVYGRFDAGRLEQVFGNLLGNACKFTPAGGSVTVRLTCAPDGWATIQVEDTGPGLPASDLPRIFERFYRGESSAKRLPGTGLGLAVAHECVALHRGEIRAENRPEGGARFTVRLRTTPAPTPDQGDRAE